MNTLILKKLPKILIFAFAQSFAMFLVIVMIYPLFTNDKSSMDISYIRILFGILFVINIPIAIKFAKK